MYLVFERKGKKRKEKKGEEGDPRLSLLPPLKLCLSCVHERRKETQLAAWLDAVCLERDILFLTSDKALGG